jgi:predicted amino acid dehydrogenase
MTPKSEMEKSVVSEATKMGMSKTEAKVALIGLLGDVGFSIRKNET